MTWRFLFANFSEIRRGQQKQNKNCDDSLGLTTELQKICNDFVKLGDDNKSRYKQLIFYANQLPPMPSTSRIPDNKVRGCSASMFLDAVAEYKDGKVIINYIGDCDGIFEKGVLALCVQGLSGNTASDIQRIDFRFMLHIDDKVTLTPSRTNGPLNMLNLMKSKALEAEDRFLEV